MKKTRITHQSCKVKTRRGSRLKKRFEDWHGGKSRKKGGGKKHEKESNQHHAMSYRPMSCRFLPPPSLASKNKRGGVQL